MKLLTLLLISTLSANASPLADALERKRIELNCPAALIAITPDDAAPVFHHLGHADREKAPLDPNSYMPIGSISKLFVGTVILHLWENNRLDLDAPISKYVPEVPSGDSITLRMLGQHTSGLPDAIRNRDFQNAINADPHKQWPVSEILKYTFTQDPFFPPGTGWKYSNTNTILLALAAEKATGKPIATLIQEIILDPLKLHHTAITSPTGLPAPKTRAYRHGKEESPIRYGTVPYDVTGWSPSWAGAAGNMHSTLQDLQLAATALSRGDLLGKKAKATLHAFRETDTPGYRYGFCIEEDDGLIGHSGDVPGFSSLLAYDPETKRSIVILTNLSNTPTGASTAKELSKVLP